MIGMIGSGIFHITGNWFVKNHPRKIQKTVGKAPTFIKTLLGGPEVGCMKSDSSKKVALATTLVLGGTAVGMAAFDPSFSLLAVLNACRWGISKTNFAKKWAKKEFAKGVQGESPSFAQKVGGMIAGPGLTIPREMGNKVQEAAVFCRDAYKWSFQEKMEWEYRGRKIILFPLLNALYLPAFQMAEDLEDLLNLLKKDNFFKNIQDLRRGGDIPEIVVDPIVGYGAFRKQEWALSILDHEVGHQNTIRDDMPTRIAFYTRMIAHNNPWVFWGATLFLEGTASYEAIKEKEHPSKTRKTVLGIAFLTYIRAAITKLTK